MDNFLDKFNNTARELIGDLRAVYPSLNESLDLFLEQYPCTDNAYMIYFIETIGKYGDLVAEKNDELFDKAEVLKGVEIKFIFAEPESAPNRAIIWKYIEAMYLYSLTYMKLNSEGGDTMEEEVRKYMETIGFNSENFNKILQNLQQSAAASEQPTDQPSSTPPNIPPEMEKMADTLFGGMIGNLAKEIAGELKTDDLETSNPQELLQNLFSPEKGNLMNLVQNISGKLQTKLDNGQLDQQALFNEATSIMNNLQNMPGMENMMKNMAGNAGSGMPGFDPSMMANLMSGLMGGAKKDNSKNLSLLPKNHPKRRRK
jgi:hypothetical protein